MRGEAVPIDQKDGDWTFYQSRLLHYGLKSFKKQINVF